MVTDISATKKPVGLPQSLDLTALDSQLVVVSGALAPNREFLQLPVLGV